MPARPIWRRALTALRRLFGRAPHPADVSLFNGLSAGPSTDTRPPGPLHADWTHRPSPWRGALPRAAVGGASTPSGIRVAPDVRVFHDGEADRIVVRHLPSRRDPGSPGDAPCALVIDLRSFSGTYASLCIELPGEVAQGLARRHIIGASVTVATDPPTLLFTRLNIRHGPETLRLPRRMESDSGRATIEFDLAGLILQERRIGHLWFELIAERPGTACIRVSDLTLFRRPRAEI